MTLSVRLTAAMVGLVVGTATAVGLLTYNAAATTFVLADLAAVLGAIILAFLLAHSMTRPLVRITRAAEAFPCIEPAALPISAGGEIGILARTFERIAADMREKTSAYEREIERTGRAEIADRQAADRGRSFIAVVEASADAIITTTLDGVIISWNAGAERLFGFTAQEAIDSNIDMIVPDDRRSEIGATLDEIRRGEAVPDFQTMRVGKEGRRLDASLSVSCIKSASGLTIGAAMVVRHIAARELSAEMFRQAVEACSCGMVMIDGAGKIVMVNTRTERLFGYQREELIGQPADIIVPARLRARHARYRADFILHPESHVGTGLDLLGRRKDGTEFPIDVSLNPIGSGEGLLVLSVIVDLSEQSRIGHLKDEFVSIVSHELRTPLTSIAGALGLLAGNAAGTLPDLAARLITIAHTNSQRLVRLINDILDIEKIESGRLVFDLKRVEVLSLVEQAIEANRGFADSYNVLVHLDAASTKGEVRADPDRLTQVLTNLLSNAIKFSPPGEKVVVATEKRGDVVRISVRDYGHGIPDGFKPRVFEKFAQGDASDTRRKGGTGLGLSIVKAIVEQLDGTVGFDDAPGGGTIFHVELPDGQHVPDTDHDRESNDARILLCEHDPNVAVALCDRLRQAGFATDFAATIGEAVTNAATNAYTAILVDLALPNGDGIGLIQRLRAQPQYLNTPIIVVSADPHRERNDLRSSTLNVLDWLDQPLDIDRLMQVLDRPIIRNASTRPHVLHVDDDPDVLHIVAQALGTSATVVSVESVESAREALATNRFDLVILDIALAAGSGLDLLPELHDTEGEAIPVIVFSGQGANPAFAERVQTALTKSRASIDKLIATLRKRMPAAATSAPKVKDVA